MIGQRSAPEETNAQRFRVPVKPAGDGPGVRPCRIALYSHDTMGIGHMRRNLTIAQAFANSPAQHVILLIAGAHQLRAFGLPAAVDCLTLPSLFKEEDGTYRSRNLKISLGDLLAVRSRAIAGALAEFAPDVLIVDKVPRGAINELQTSLEFLRAGRRTRCVLGLRDVLDDPETVCREWGLTRDEDAIRDYYDAVWVYGDPAVYDPVREYHLGPEVSAKVRYTGYLDRAARTHLAQIDGAEMLKPLTDSSDRLFLCLLGGGQDGSPLAEAFAEADFPPRTTAVIVTGPFLAPETYEKLCRRAAAKPHLRLLRFVTDCDLLLDRADRIVGMGGYNTICEVLSFAKPALIVPRVKPRREQYIRAERLRALGLLDVLHPDGLTPRALSAWLARDLKSPPVRDRINLDGVARLPHLLEEVLAAPPAPSPYPLPRRAGERVG
jgi:predicted glycosyltransferase